MRIPEQLNYKTENAVSPVYRYMRIPLNNLTGNTTTITASSGQQLQFKLPPVPYNLNRSLISYQLAPGAAGASNYNVIPQDVLSLISTLQFGLNGGPYLCDLNYCNNYSKVARKLSTKLKKFLEADPVSKLFPSNMLRDVNLRAESVTPAANDPYGLPAAATFSSIKNYVEEQHLIISPVGGQTPDVSLIKDNVMLPLGALKDTIMELDKDLYFPVEMYLNIQTANANKILWTSTSASNPSSSAADVANTLTINNIYLYLAVEKDPVIVDSLIAKFKSGGLRMQIPYTVVFRNSSTAPNTSIQIQLTKQYGKKLKHITHMVFNNTEHLNTMYDCNNYNAEKTQYYRTFLNSVGLQDDNLYCYQPGNSSLPSGNPGLEDWRVNQDHCRDSVIQNAGQYQMNWFHRDSWVLKPEDQENVDDGLDMSEYPVVLWQYQSVQPGSSSYQNYSFATFLREFVVRQDGFEYVS